MKRTFQPSNLKRARTHGFRARMATKAGRLVIKRRRAKGRIQLTPAHTQIKVARIVTNNSSDNSTTNNRFNICDRISVAGEYKQVFRGGQRIKGKYFLLIFYENQNNTPRLGLAISKKYCRLASKRNKIKRIIRESFRKNKDILSGVDVVVLNTLSTHNVTSKILFKSIELQWHQIKNR